MLNLLSLLNLSKVELGIIHAEYWCISQFCLGEGRKILFDIGTDHQAIGPVRCPVNIKGHPVDHKAPVISQWRIVGGNDLTLLFWF